MAGDEETLFGDIDIFVPLIMKFSTAGAIYDRAHSE